MAELNVPYGERAEIGDENWSDVRISIWDMLRSLQPLCGLSGGVNTLNVSSSNGMRVMIHAGLLTNQRPIAKLLGYVECQIFLSNGKYQVCMYMPADSRVLSDNRQRHQRIFGKPPTTEDLYHVFEECATVLFGSIGLQLIKPLKESRLALTSNSS